MSGGFSALPINTDVIGNTTEPFVHAIDERWLMAYSAGLGDMLNCYVDTTREFGIVGHPLFSICVEWPAIEASRDLLYQYGLTPDERYRVVHSTHDVAIHRLIRPGDQLVNKAHILSVTEIRSGAIVLVRVDTLDEKNVAVASTIQGHVYRNVAVYGKPLSLNKFDSVEPDRIHKSMRHFKTVKQPIAANAGHVYTECARIFNPIHTDLAIAKASGLPTTILHGSATLALAVSNIVRELDENNPNKVLRIYGKFRGIVRLPSSIEIIIYPPSKDTGRLNVRFEVKNAEGEPAIADGLVTLMA